MSAYEEEVKLNTAAGAKVRGEKHTELHNAIEHVDSVNSALCQLIGQITGTPPESSTKPDQQSPSLSDVLEAGPDHIREKLDTAHNSISRIRELLF